MATIRTEVKKDRLILLLFIFVLNGIFLPPAAAHASTYGSDTYGSATFGGGAPSVTTSAASSIAQTSATLNATITDIGSSSPSVRGFVYGASVAYDATTTDSAGSFSTGTFNTSLTSFTCGTLYHFAGYATNAVGVAYGSDAVFTTSGCASTSVGGSGGGGGGGGSGGTVLPTVTASSSAPLTTNTPVGGAASSTPLQPSQTCATSSNSYTFTRGLETGMHGNDVQALQIFLNTHHFPITTTGAGSFGQETTFFGTGTFAALVAFQTANSLTTDTGYFGPKTRAIIAKFVGSCSGVTPVAAPATIKTPPAYSAAPASAAVRTLVVGMSGSDVSLLQKQLLALPGIFPGGSVSGYFGPLTEGAVGNFQFKYGIIYAADDPGYGIVGQKTRAKLNAIHP